MSALKSQVAKDAVIPQQKIPAVTWLAYTISSFQSNQGDPLTDSLREVVASKNYRAEEQPATGYQDIHAIY